LLADCLKQLKHTLPGDYVEFLKLGNGGEGFVGASEYLILWGAEELVSMNEAYEVQKYVPGLLLFGSNGGGEAYGFDTRSPEWLVVRVPFVGMDWNLAQFVSTSFTALLKRLYETE